ncbi:hypothetical protein AF335_21065 [Streptomyces eurocidicus]|uniref:Uncharacterized protein n=1 Tax=Streptomyces eurocidicus TaxID=66423 RepID=A0A2N8NTW1_STREU|nr:hypothetical protein AF335_21065 [Streptomyces eurocidicus]
MVGDGEAHTCGFARARAVFGAEAILQVAAQLVGHRGGDRLEIDELVEVEQSRMGQASASASLFACGVLRLQGDAGSTDQGCQGEALNDESERDDTGRETPRTASPETARTPRRYRHR